MFSLLLLAVGLVQDGTVRGIVRAEGSGEPIAYARVELIELGRAVPTDERGFYVLPDVPAGRWRIRATSLGFAAGELTVVTDGSSVVRLDFDLALDPVRLAGIPVRSTDEDARDAGRASVAAAGPPPARLAAGPMLMYMPAVAEADVLRSLAPLPSVTMISDYSSALYVRGGRPDQTLLTLDGLPLFNPYHLGGLFSAIGAHAVSGVSVWTGALPARFGDRLAGVVEINPRRGGRDRVRASGLVGLISTHATVDGPLPGGSGSFLLSGRRTYIDAATRGAYAVGLLDVVVPYGFTDLFGRVTHDTGALGSITLTGYLNAESVDTPERMRDEIDGDIDMGWGSRMVALSYRRPIGGSTTLDARVGYSDFSGDFDQFEWPVISGGAICVGDVCHDEDVVRDTVQMIDAAAAVRDIVVDAQITHHGRSHRIDAGVRFDGYATRQHARRDDEYEEYLPPLDRADHVNTVAAYLEDEWRLGERVQLRGGIRRLDAGSLGAAWLPRLGARVELGRGFAATLGAGRYAQAIRSMRDDEAMLSSLIAYDVFAAQPRDVGLARSEDVVAGIEWTGVRTRARMDAYARRMEGLLFADELDDPLYTQPLIVDTFRTGTGKAHGIELSAHHQTDRFDIGLSYAYGRVRMRAGEDEFTPRYDRRHQADATLITTLGERGVASARIAIAGGQPYTPVAGITIPLVYEPGSGRWTGGDASVLLGEHNSERLPAYVRVDIAARKSYDKRWFGADMTITPYLQILNVLNTKNVLLADPETGGRPQVNYWPQLPILPTFGVEWRF